MDSGKARLILVTQPPAPKHPIANRVWWTTNSVYDFAKLIHYFTTEDCDKLKVANF